VSLKARLHCLFILTLLGALSVGTALIVHDARRSVREEVSSSLSLAQHLLETSPERAMDEEGMGRLTRQLVELGSMRHLRAIVHPADSERAPMSPVHMEHTGVPALFVWLTEPEPQRVEKWLGKPYDSPGIVIEARPEDEIAEVWGETRRFLGILLWSFLGVYALVLLLLGRAFRHVDAILVALRRVENGDYSQRLPEFPQPEFRQIAGAFNHAAEALQKARADNLALAGHSLRVQEEERRTIARELHDELGQSLSAVKALSAAIRGREGDGETHQAASAIAALCDTLFDSVRGLVRRLRPAMIDELGLQAALEDLRQSWEKLHPEIRFDLEFAPGVEEADSEVKIQLFRIVQECLTNCVRHAAAQCVAVKVAMDSPGWVTVQVRDDGRGFDASRPREGFGISGMRERVSCLGGHFSLTSAPNRGARVEARIPLQTGAPGERA
jgi:two-component system sensor histidine kinase UhpB